jgi:hypothetical protein
MAKLETLPEALKRDAGVFMIMDFNGWLPGIVPVAASAITVKPHRKSLAGVRTSYGERTR